MGIQMWKKYNGADDKTHLRKVKEAYFWKGHDKPKCVIEGGGGDVYSAVTHGDIAVYSYHSYVCRAQ
jgi:hypothetical protein